MEQNVSSLTSQLEQSQHAAGNNSQLEVELENLQVEIQTRDSRISEIEAELEQIRSTLTQVENEKNEISAELAQSNSQLEISSQQLNDQVEDTQKIQVELQQRVEPTHPMILTIGYAARTYNAGHAAQPVSTSRSARRSHLFTNDSDLHA